MEPNEFDQLINDKLSQENDLYQKEILNSQPYVWGEIQKETNPRVFSMAWYVAAAAIFLILFSSLFFFKTTEQYKTELNLLAYQIKELKNNQSQAGLIQLKNEQLDILCSTIDALEQVTNREVEAPQLTQKVIIQKQIVHHIDTIYLKTKPIEILQQNIVENISPKVKSEETKVENEVSDLIYPDYKSSNVSQKQEQAPLKIIINPFKN